MCRSKPLPAACGARLTTTLPPHTPTPTLTPPQVPANIVMIRVGFKPWLSFLLVAWGIVASCFSLINSVWSFYLLRVLLGIFEAGAFPAMWYALSTFFPRRRWAEGLGGQGHGGAALRCTAGPATARRRLPGARCRPPVCSRRAVALNRMHSMLRPLAARPPASLTKPYAYLTMGIMGANMIGAPLGFGLLSMDGIGGLK